MKKFTYFILVISTCFLLINPEISSSRTVEKIIESAVKSGTRKGVKGGSSAVLSVRIGIASTKGWAAHHIIPIQLKNHRVLKKISFDLDQEKNGIALPTKVGMHPTFPIHAGSHPNYTAAVARELDKIPTKLSIEETQKKVDELIDIFRKKLERGTPLHKQEGIDNPWK